MTPWLDALAVGVAVGGALLYVLVRGLRRVRATFRRAAPRGPSCGCDCAASER